MRAMLRVFTSMVHTPICNSIWESLMFNIGGSCVQKDLCLCYSECALVS